MIAGGTESEAAQDRPRRAFRSADDFAVEAHRLADALAPGSLADAVRSAATRGAASIAMAAADRARSRPRLLEARDELVAARYLLHLGRRMGALDVRRFRAAVTRHEAAMRDLEAWIREVASG